MKTHRISIILSVISCLVFFISCSLRPKDKLGKAPLQISKKLEEIKKQYKEKKYQQVIESTNHILESHRATDIGDEALFLLAKTHSHLKNWEKAFNVYKEVYSSKYESSGEAYSRVTACKILAYKLGRHKEALDLIDRSIKTKINEQQKAELLEARFISLMKTGAQLEAFETLVKLSEEHPIIAQRDNFKRKAQDFIDSRLSGTELKDFANDRSESPLKENAMYRYGIHLMGEGRYSEARSYLKKVVKNRPKSYIGNQAKKFLDQMNTRDKVNPRTIGIILPLSGRYSKIGYETLQGLQLALGVKGGKNKEGLRLAIIDSRGKPEYARQGVKRLVEEDHVISIIGGFLSKTSYYGAIQAQELGVPFIALSQKEGLTDIGPFIFRNALTIESQMDKLIELTMSQMKFKKFAILYPNDPYGVKVSNIFWKKVKEKGGGITGAQTYPPGETDFSEPIRKLIGTFYLDDRKEEYRQRLRKWYRDQAKKGKRRKKPPVDLLPPIVDFDAVFIPDGIKAFGQIAPMLAYNDVNDVFLMGTNIWNTREFIQRGQNFVSKALFTDSFYKKDKNFVNSGFYKNYSKIFGEKPSGFSLLGYDSGLVIRSVLNQKIKTRLDFSRQIQKNHKIPGVLNTLTLNKKREFIRPVVLLTAKDGEIVPFINQ